MGGGEKQRYLGYVIVVECCCVLGSGAANGAAHSA